MPVKLAADFECVVLVRLPSGKVMVVMDENDEDIHVFRSVDEVDDLAKTNRWLMAFPYQIVELDEI